MMALFRLERTALALGQGCRCGQLTELVWMDEETGMIFSAPFAPNLLYSPEQCLVPASGFICSVGIKKNVHLQGVQCTAVHGDKSLTCLK
ncbi:hypothetical protein AOLI_G00025040 [Acnodon oligacanthus]